MNSQETLENAAEQGATLVKHYEDKIRHILSIYVVISPTMLQAGLGPGSPAKLWKPVLEEMVRRGEVVREEVHKESPAGRTNPYTLLRLSSTDIKVAA